MKTPEFKVYNYTRSGKRLTNGRYLNKINEDCRKTDIYRRIFITADGMGGHLEAKTASQHATLLVYDDMVNIQKIIRDRQFSDKEILEILSESVQERNKYIHAWSKIQSANNCGTTIDGIIIDAGKIFGVHVGDGTVYKIDTQKITIQTLTNTDKNIINGSENLSDLEKDLVYSNILSNHLGLEKVAVQTYVHELSKNDTIIMATDGFTKKVHPEEILQAFDGGYCCYPFNEGMKNLKEYCRKPQKMAAIVDNLRLREYHVSKGIFCDDTTFIAIQARD